ncbi:unnamed protein product [Rotaria sp. Silwood2]|nr:unnamed protein product [Rotaria sp. Silwood2]CAF4416566.1 unnamed protein product [Rotaria sp. Silwood2]CAF4418171.1 unnamed protein product [Rotaria sp. Silwood2]
MLRLTNVDFKPIRLSPVYGYRTHPLLQLREALDPLITKINQLDEFIKIAKSECHFPSEHNLTRDESAAIYLYTMEWGEQSLYRVMNAALRKEDRSVLVPWYGYLKLFDTALNKLPSVPQNLWRGVKGDISKNYKKDDEFTWWCFTSCSPAVNVVKNFLGSPSTLFMIEAKNGKSISKYSSFSNEDEVILPLGTRIRVVYDVLDHQSLNVVHLRELTDENDQPLTTSLSNLTIKSSMNVDVDGRQILKSNNSSTVQTWTCKNGDRYEGECQNEQKHGRGTYYYASGEKYTGDWIDDQKTGEGIFTWTSGDRYEGQFKNGNFNGKGTFYYANGNIYTGDWINDKKEGEGVFKWPNGARYEGQFKNGSFHGKGTYYYANGNKYEGDWIDDKKTGQGIFTLANGERYEGQFRDGNFNGKGTYFYANGNCYVGDWVDDKKEGGGIFTWANGNRYKGHFKNDNKHGKGKLYYADGNVQRGRWNNDFFKE